MVKKKLFLLIQKIGRVKPFGVIPIKATRQKVEDKIKILFKPGYNGKIINEKELRKVICNL